MCLDSGRGAAQDSQEGRRASGKWEGRLNKVACSWNLQGSSRGTGGRGKSGKGEPGKLENVVCVPGRWVNVGRPLGCGRVICKATWGCMQGRWEERGATEGSEGYNRLCDLRHVMMTTMTKMMVKMTKNVSLFVLATQKMTI